MKCMPDREKVIKEFEHLLNAAKGNYQDFVDLTIDGGEEILALLKEQEAVEPKHNPLSPTDWFCGKCGMCISRFHDYCPSCGQAVMWE